MLPTRTLCVVRARTFCCSPASHAGDAMRKQVQPRRVRVAANGRARAAARLVLQELRARQPVRAMPCCSEPLLLCPVAVTLWLVACCTPCGMLYEALRDTLRVAFHVQYCALPCRRRSACACVCVLSLPMRVHVIARVCACRCVRLRAGARAWVARHRHDCAWPGVISASCAPSASMASPDFQSTCRPSRTVRAHTRVPTRA